MRRKGWRVRAAVAAAALIFGVPAAPLRAATGPAARPEGALTYKGIALGMTKRDVCSRVLGMAFANEVPCKTWQGDTLSPPRPDPDFDRLGQIPVLTIIHFDRRDGPDARVDEVVLSFSHADYPAVRATLAQRYGPPTEREAGTVRGDGRPVASEMLVWRRPGGLIRLLERFDEMNRSGVLFLSTARPRPTSNPGGARGGPRGRYDVWIRTMTRWGAAGLARPEMAAEDPAAPGP